MRRWGQDRWALVFILLLAWALRLLPVLDNRFHADEALYGYWGLLIGRGEDPWLAEVPVDKPPLMPYLVAGTQALFGSQRGSPWGSSEFSVRLPGLAAGLLTVPLTAGLAYSLYRERWIATVAGVVAALSPFAILFSATAFTDPVMVMLGLAACGAAARGRPGWAGLLVGLAFATKQTGLAWLPLVIGVQVANWRRRVLDLKPQVSTLFWLLPVIGLVSMWDIVRVGQGAESFWRLGIISYGGLRPIWPQELWTRLRGWVELARYLFVSPVVNGLLMAGLPALVWCGVRRPRCAAAGLDTGRYTRKSSLDLLLVAFLLIYFFLHWLWAFPVWDRYLLPLVPVLAILVGRMFSILSGCLQTAGRRAQVLSSLIGHCLLFVCLAVPALKGAQSRYPVGGDHWAYDGIEKVAAYLQNLPEGAVVYHHWLGWHYAYHLFDAPIYLAYWPTPAWLARDVQAFGVREPRYITFPSWESSARVEQALAGVGYELEPVLTTIHRDGTPSFTVYHTRALFDQ